MYLANIHYFDTKSKMEKNGNKETFEFVVKR